MQMDTFEQARVAQPGWDPAFPSDWERPKREEIYRIQSTYNVVYSQQFIDFQLTECLVTPMGDRAFDGFGWASPGIEPLYSLSDVVEGAQQLGVPSNLAPFRDDNSDIFCITDNGEVVVWGHNSNGLYSTDADRWLSFAAWLLASLNE